MMRGSRISLTIAIAVGMLAMAGCNKGDSQAGEPADSVGRNLTLAPNTSTPALNDMPLPDSTAPAAAPAPASAPAAAPRKAPSAPARKPPPAPAPAKYTADAGTRVALAVNDTISSRTAKAGEAFTARVQNDVTDAAGHVVIPAGSVFAGTIVEVKAGGASSTGTLTLALNSVSIHGTVYPVEATIESVSTVRQGRGVTGKEAAKVGVGAAAGAIAGRIIGKNTRGTVIGGIVGAAAGAGVAAATREVDIVLPAGGTIDISLTQPLTVAAH